MAQITSPCAGVLGDCCGLKPALRLRTAALRFVSWFSFGGLGLLRRLALATPLLLTGRALAISPHLVSLLPTGGQRGTQVEAIFEGERLQDTEQIFCYESGLEVLKLDLVTNKTVKAQLKLAPDCPLGEHHLRLRTRTGLSEVVTFMVGSLPVLEEIEPNNDAAHAQKVPLNTTVTGVVKPEDVDCFAVEVKKGQRLSVEVEGMRLGRGVFDPRLTIQDTKGKLLADVDDTWLAMQDPFTSFVADTDQTCIVQLREVTYGGGNNFYYRMHIGSFPRPTSVFPLGGKTNETVAFTFFSPATGPFVQKIKLPDAPSEKYGLFAELDGQSAPSPNWIRVSNFPNILGTAANHDREHATAADQEPPFALNGTLTQPGQEDWFRFPAQKDKALEVTVFARRLRSPLDSVLEVFNHKGESLASNDDTAGADSSLKFTPSETTNYFVRIRDTLGQGGTDYVYRIEITPVHPEMAVKIPEVARNDTQSRQFITVPRGNRFATLISARRQNFKGELAFHVDPLPPGVTLTAAAMAENIDAMPLVFEATTNAPVGGALTDLGATWTNGTDKVTGKFRQNIDLVEGPNNSTFYSTSVEKLCVAVTEAAPFKLRIVEPRVPLVQAGSMPLEIVAERAPGFTEPIEVQMVWNPPGVSSQPEATIPKEATNVMYQLNASGGADAHTWQIAVVGHATVDGGELYVSSQLSPLEIATPFVTGKIETLWLNPGKSGKLTVNLQQAKAFDGKATIRLCGLPDKATVSDQEITKGDQEATFEVKAEAGCRTGAYKNLFCTVDVPQQGQLVRHTIAQGGILRIVPPKKPDSTVARGN
ncbi:MAG TPA: PPC domain-containing protein [Verrucomicrobiae bacterium]|nr:PPC domain-containing protein [Verrucomicrobiae bacterium]